MEWNLGDQPRQGAELPAEQSGRDAIRRRDRRFLAVGLLTVFAIFSGLVAGVLIATYLAGSDSPDESAALESVRVRLQADPSEQAAATFRDEDRRVRQVYLTYQERLWSGAWLLLAGVALAVICAKWYSSMDPKPAVPGRVLRKLDEDAWRAAERRNVVAVGVVCGFVALAGVALAHLGGGSFPRGTDRRVVEELAIAERPGHDFTENWPRFRGADGLGVVPQGTWPMEWDAPAGRNVLWRTPVPSAGKSSPVIWGDRIFLSAADAKTRELLCFDRATGKLRWRTRVKAPGPGEGAELNVMEDTGYAASTPATDGKRVYVFYANADLAAVDFSGKVVWAQNLGKPENSYGLAVSLLTHAESVIVQFDRGSSPDDRLSAVMALDGKTGRVRWRTPRPVPNSWSTPIIADTESGKELITCGDPWVISYDPADGSELWRARALSGDVAPGPVYADGVVFATNDYARVIAIRAGDFGDVTETNIVWSAEEGMSDASSPVTDGKLFLQANSAGIVTCYDAKSGKLQWRKEIEEAFWASPTLVGELVYLPSEKGKTYIFRFTRKFEQTAVLDCGEPVYATPAFADSRIYFRGKKHLFCIGYGGE